MDESTLARFWSKIEKRTAAECWPWLAARSGGGYGAFNVSHRHQTRAHRIAFEMTYGVIPPGMFVCHRCDNPPCCNPGHLFLGTNSDNLRDASAKGRLGANSGERNGTRTQPHRRARGERMGNSRLTPDRVRELRRRVAAGDRHKDIARDLGICRTTVGDVMRGKTWGHIT